jgi:hypothetical protein
VREIRAGLGLNLLLSRCFLTVSGEIHRRVGQHEDGSGVLLAAGLGLVEARNAWLGVLENYRRGDDDRVGRGGSVGGTTDRWLVP